MKNSFLTDFGKPVLVLFTIALAVGLLLSLVHTVTNPVITENARVKAEEARKNALPGADTFTEMDKANLAITGAYREDSGLGYVFTAANKGYGGLVTVTVGIDQNGQIVRVLADVSTETKGVGTKAGKEAYLENFNGDPDKTAGVDTLSGATFSSGAVKKGIEQIVNAYNLLVKGGVE